MEFLGKICSELEKKLHVARMTASTITLKLLVGCFRLCLCFTVHTSSSPYDIFAIFKVRAPDAPVITEKYLGCGRCDAVTRMAHLPGATANGIVLHVEVKKLMRAINPVITDLRGVSILQLLLLSQQKPWLSVEYCQKFIFYLQIGIQLTHLKEIISEQARKQPSNRNTLTQFFAVRSRGQQLITRKKKFMRAEDFSFQLALKRSCEDVEKRLVSFYLPTFQYSLLSYCPSCSHCHRGHYVGIEFVFSTLNKLCVRITEIISKIKT